MRAGIIQLLLASTVSLWLPAVHAGEYGLTGFPANGYDPICATSCLRSLNALTLNCSSEGFTIGMQTFQTSTECFAQDEPFLKSVAWCAHTMCHHAHPSASLMEYWWDMQVTGQKTAGVRTVPAKWSYGQALAEVEEPPTLQLTATDTSLNETSLAPMDVYEAQFNVLWSTQNQGFVANQYGIALLVISFGLPVVLTALGYLPGTSKAISKARPYLVWPSSFADKHVQSLPYLLGKPPTIGQALYVLLFLILNIVFTAAGYQSRQPNAWNPTVRHEIMAYIIGRTGTIAYVTMPLLWLFGGRNNILLWMSNWSHSTFMTLHRWVARVYMVQAVLHSIVALVKYQETGMYSMEVVKSYWIWGVIATVFTVFFCFASGLYVRNLHYQIFIVVHVVLSVFILVGCWYHAYDLYGMLGGYGFWMYATAAVWAFDRIGRLVRMWIAGICRARVTELGGADGYARIDIPGIRWGNRPGKHAYLYFPSLTPFAPWVNHPFSVMPTNLLNSSFYRGKDVQSPANEDESSSNPADSNEDVEKSAAVVNARPRRHDNFEVGLTFFVKKSIGTTKKLRTDATLLTLVEGPYPNNSSDQILACDRVLLIGGGIGITALVPFVASHHNVKLCWSVNKAARCLVDELDGMLEHVHEKHISVGGRLDIQALLAAESDAGWKKVGVVIAGPPQMCDEARALVTAEAKRSGSTEFALEVEAYSW